MFVPGYGAIATSVRAIQVGAVEFLVKPFGERALLDAVSETLKKSRHARGERAVRIALRPEGTLGASGWSYASGGAIGCSEEELFDT